MSNKRIFTLLNKKANKMYAFPRNIVAFNAFEFLFAAMATVTLICQCS